MTPKEITIQENIYKRLVDLELYPYSVIFTYAIGNNGLLSVSFYRIEQLNELLEKLDYKSQCDKTGYIIVEESATIILSGIALIKFYTEI